MEFTNNCLVCAKDFDSHWEATYCSNACRQKSWRYRAAMSKRTDPLQKLPKNPHKGTGASTLKDPDVPDASEIPRLTRSYEEFNRLLEQAEREESRALRAERSRRS